MNQKIEVIQALIDKGANIDARDVELETPLHIAARLDDLVLVDVLVKNGANSSAENLN